MNEKEQETLRAWTAFPVFADGIYRADQPKGCEQC